jgi:phosphoglycolate phosphatase
MKYKAAIFDLDGTLVDSLEDLADSVNGMLAQNGFPIHPLDAYQYFVGEGVITLLKRALPSEHAGDDAFVLKCLDVMNEEYLRRWHHKTRPYEGMVDLLKTMDIKGMKLAVLSNKPHHFTSLMVPHFFPDIPFGAIIGARPESPRKPDPAAAIEIADILGVMPQECMYIGDSNIDMMTGKKAGMFTIGVLWGFRPEAELRETGADVVVSAASEIAQFIV